MLLLPILLQLLVKKLIVARIESVVALTSGVVLSRGMVAVAAAALVRRILLALAMRMMTLPSALAPPSALAQVPPPDCIPSSQQVSLT